MRVLVSFCNQPENSKKNLLLLDIKTGEKKYLLNTSDGFTGLAQDNRFFYALSQNLETGLVVIDKVTNETVFNSKLQNLLDPHSLIIDGGFIYVVSTGNDQVIKYEFDKKKLAIKFMELVWSPSGSKKMKDTHHINSIFRCNNSIYISAFGLREGDRWSSAQQGYVQNITNNRKEIENIYHPHALFIQDEDYYYCESSTRSIKKNQKKILTLKTGYTRGLYLSGNHLFLGTSCGRKKSKSTGELNNPADSGIMEEDCRVLFFLKNFFGLYRLKKEFNFFPTHKEIYDIIIIK